MWKFEFLFIFLASRSRQDFIPWVWGLFHAMATRNGGNTFPGGRCLFPCAVPVMMSGPYFGKAAATANGEGRRTLDLKKAISRRLANIPLLDHGGSEREGEN